MAPTTTAIRHGIFALECNWWGVQCKTSIEPVLELLHRLDGYNIPYIHHDVGTRHEFDYYLDKWCHPDLAHYPTLYLGFHGSPDGIEVGDLDDPDGIRTLDQLGEQLAGKCKGRVILFGSCSIFATRTRSLNRFLELTHAAAILGYTKDIEWLPAASLDVLLLGTLQEVSFTKRGMKKAERLLHERAGDAIKNMGLRIQIRA